MDQKILVFAGSKQSGKSSAANFVAGYILTQMGRQGIPYCPVQFDIDEEGQLIVNTAISVNGELEFGDGIMDLHRQDDQFLDWAINILWPYVKIYSFANTLKETVINVFGLPRDKVYGTDLDKRTLTHIKWKDMCALLPPKHVSELKKGGKYDEKMNIREFLQYFGTNVCRKLYDDCWFNNTYSGIFYDMAGLSIIDDCRFANEVRKSRKNGAKIIKFTRKVDYDLHESENDLEGLNSASFDLIIDNEFMTIKEKNQAVLDGLYIWGWLGPHISLENKKE